MAFHFDCITRPLSNVYGRYARVVFRNPLPFLLIPVALSLALGTGFMYIELYNDVDYLFTPTNAESKTNREYIDNVYSDISKSGMLTNRLATPGSFGRVIISGNENQNLLQTNEFSEVLRVYETVMNIAVAYSGLEYVYSEICVTWAGNCRGNSILEIYDYNATIVPLKNITYPFTIGASGEIFAIGTGLGRVEVAKESGIVLSAGYIMLSYYLESSEVSELWEEEFLKSMKEFDSEVVKVARDASSTVPDEFLEATFSVIPLIPVAFIVLVSFSLLSTATRDWVQNKPMLTLLGVLSAVFGGLGATGLMLLIGVKFTPICALTPIIIMSIGIDDMFILIASWRKTNVQSSTEDRLSETLSEAALSITITSLTDCLAFAVGCTSIFPAVRLFCIYNAVSILFVYIYVITFFLACMAIIGQREADNKHCITLRSVVPADEATGCYKIFCAGGPSKSVLASDSSHIVMLFFRDYFGPFMGRAWTKAATLLVYAVYLGFSVWGATKLEQGMDIRDIVLQDSYTIDFSNIEMTAFQTYGPLVQIVITEEVEYWQSEVNNDIMGLHRELETSEYGLDSTRFTDSWIRTFNQYLVESGQTITDKTTFLNILNNQFLLRNEFKHFELDLVFNGNRTAIVSSRFLVGSKRNHVGIDTAKDVALMDTFREIVAGSGFRAFAFNPLFTLFDQYKIILSATLKNLGIALAAMMVVSLLMIPRPVCSMWVVASIASIELGVLGIMPFWGVRLDTVTMVNIILCIGFSVDFTAHMSYVYTVSPASSRNGKLIDAYYTIGMPLSQAAISTLLGIFVLVNSETGIFIAFFKTLFLVITIGLIHGLFFLPVLLSLSPIAVNAPEKASETRQDTADVVQSRVCGNNNSYCNKGTQTINNPENIAVEIREPTELIPNSYTHSRHGTGGSTNPAFMEDLT